MGIFSKLLIASTLVSAVCGEVYFKETFDGDLSRWTNSNWKAGQMGKFEITSGDWNVDASAEKGLTTTQPARFYGITAPLDKTLNTENKDLVLQFSVKHEKREYSFCAGGYIKLMPLSSAGTEFGGDSPYQIMFGPDMCGYDISRIHAIFNHNGENLLKEEDIKLEYADKNEFTHVYTLHVKQDNTYAVYFDSEIKSEGSLHDGWGFPNKTIDDPTDSKPTDWVDEAEIVDVTDTKPEGWDDIPAKIPDPEATKPDDWDDEDDGEWEAPMLSNPEFKGEWTQKMIANPAYKGEWSPKQIPNPDFIEKVGFYNDIGAIGLDLWVVNEGSIYDNIMVTDSIEEALEFAKLSKPTQDGEEDVKKAWDELNKPAEPEAAEAADPVVDAEEVHTEL